MPDLSDAVECADVGDGLTIVIPAYNASRYIRDCVQAALSNRGVREIIVVDDGSTDDTATITQSLEPGSGGRLCLVRQPNAGPAAARNAGLRRARTRYVGFVDADDILMPGWAEAVTRALDGGAVVAVTDAHVIDPDGTVLARYYGECPFPVGDQQEAILRSNFLLSTAAVDRAHALAVGGFDERRELVGVEDWALWLKMILSGGRAALTPDILSCYRRGHASLSSDSRRMKQGEVLLLSEMRPLVSGRAGLAAAWRAGRRELRVQERVIDLRRLIDNAPRRAGGHALSLGWLMRSKRMAAAGLMLALAPRLGRRLLDGRL